MSGLRQSLVSHPSQVAFFYAGAEKSRPNPTRIFPSRYRDGMPIVKKAFDPKIGVAG
jgi:hypothetical protein